VIRGQESPVMVALPALGARSMGTGAVHPEARTGNSGRCEAVGVAEPGWLAGAEPPRGVPACGAVGWWRSSAIAPAVPPAASTTRASTSISTRPRRRRRSGAGSGGRLSP
jgi:hypothetical protein